MIQIATARAEEVLAEKEKAASGGEAGTRKLKPLAKQAVTTLLQSFGSYVERQVMAAKARMYRYQYCDLMFRCPLLNFDAGNVHR